MSETIGMSNGLLAELRAEQPRRQGCSVCHWIAERPQAEREEWAAAFADPVISTAAIRRAMQTRGFRYGRNPVDAHRWQHHDAR